jgi:hypothetical protein
MKPRRFELQRRKHDGTWQLISGHNTALMAAAKADRVAADSIDLNRFYVLDRLTQQRVRAQDVKP